MTTRGLLLPSLREVADTLHITDDTGQIIEIPAVAFRTRLGVALVDMPAIVADRIRDVEREIVASLLRSHAQQVAVLLPAQMFLQVHVQGRAAREVLDVFAAVQPEFVDYIQ